MNIAQRISEQARLYPSKKSVVFSELQKDGSYKYPFYTFAEFEARSNQFANIFSRLGIRKGTRTLLFVTPRLDFSVLTFALFKVGAIPVLIDPGMGVKNLLNSIKQVRPDALVSIGKVHWLRRLLPKHFKSIKINISLDKVGGSTHYLYNKLENESKILITAPMRPHDLAAILFTSGGTGIPKGVLYTHGILNAQTDALKSMFKLNSDETDVPGFPLFALFTLAMGMTSVIPDLDPTKPAQCDPKKIVQNILDNSATFVAGSPAIWEKVGRYCHSHQITLPSLKYVVMFGAPVRLEVHELFRTVLVNGDTYTPYGATECLPVSLISGTEILTHKKEQMLSGLGTCVGKAVTGTEIKIVKTTDIPKKVLETLPPGNVGEIVVTGNQVTPAYFEMNEETQKVKIFTDGRLWHRMGDLGWLDEDKNLWFLGRKSHRVELSNHSTLYPLQVEAIFNQHPDVKRSALVKIMKNKRPFPALVIERHDGKTKDCEIFKSELMALKNKTRQSDMISEFLLHPSFPVDVRHNIKIDRLKLSSWAQKRIGR